jgi:1-phosphofructokinase family hexose kinase
MILAINMNPALDKTIVVPDFSLGRIFRPSELLSLPGGKGFNFMRALRTLDPKIEGLVVGPLGGHMGKMVWNMAQAEGLAWDGIWIEGETRTCLSIIDPHTNCTTELYEVGPELHPDDWNGLTAKIRSLLSRATWIVFCGSSPRGMPQDGILHLIEEAHAARVHTVVDTHGSSLAQAIETRPYLVKINHHEASALLGWTVKTPAEAINAASEIQSRGVRAVVITLGQEGAIGLDLAGEPFGWRAPSTPNVSAVGSGDSFLAGIVVSLAEDPSLKNAVRLGIAAGAANTLQIGAGKFQRLQVESILDTVRPLTF